MTITLKLKYNQLVKARILLYFIFILEVCLNGFYFKKFMEIMNFLQLQIGIRYFKI